MSVPVKPAHNTEDTNRTKSSIMEEFMSLKHFLEIRELLM